MIDGRNTLTTIVQSSAVELFQGFGIAIAPIVAPRALPSGVDQMLGAAATFSSPVLTGTLTLFVPNEIHAAARNPSQRQYEPRDWTRELCNQLLGRIKNRLHGCGIELRTGLPASVAGTLLSRRRSEMRPEDIFGFRTLRGEVTVTLAGQIDFARIRYTGKNCAAKEGDVILF
jgi:hypothetical protein